MKVTPLEIRQKNFEKNFRGYDKDEVNAFLLTLSQEWERLVDEGKELRIKLEAAEKEVTKLREVEGSLFKTLKTAEDTGTTLVEQSRQSAELLLRETHLKAEGMLNEAKMKAKDTLEEAELRAKQVLVEMEDRLRTLAENYKKLEATRDDLLHELKRISQDSIERVERIRNAQKDFDVDKHLSQARKEIKKVVYPNQNTAQVKEPVLPPLPQPLMPEPEVEMVTEQVVVNEVKNNNKKITSFFDEIG